MNLYHYLITKSRQYPFNTIIAILAIMGGYLALLFMDYRHTHEHISSCPFKLLTGIPCPGCGMGRATLALFAGDISQSFYYNILCIPLSIIILISLCWLFYDLLRGRESFFKTVRRPIQLKYQIPIFILLLITWILNIKHKI